MVGQDGSIQYKNYFKFVVVISEFNFHDLLPEFSPE
jgi:hypothetical protein